MKKKTKEFYKRIELAKLQGILDFYIDIKDKENALKIYTQINILKKQK